MYYLLIILSVIMFGVCFALNDAYRKIRGSSLKISLQSVFVGSLAGLIVLLAVNGITLELTPFTLILAICTACNGFLFTFCSFRALDRINLSLYSLFSMLGGMLLPFAQGILCYGESVTWAKVICFIFICAALLCTVERGERKNGTIYYIGIFTLNGMSGVLSKIFSSGGFTSGTEGIFATTSDAAYSAWSALCSVVLSGALLLLFFRKQPSPKMGLKDNIVGATSGAVNKVANFLLVVALAHVDASVQYPMVTGGVIIASTVICFFGKSKPKKKEIISVILAFTGLLALFLIPV